jgi:bifunctional non-homologous end joining protein LigD
MRRAGPRAGPTATVAGVRITAPDRIVFAPLGVTKRHLAEFYATIADWALPHMRRRPTTLVRCPEQVPCYYEVHEAGWAPADVRRIAVPEKTKVGEYAVVESAMDLVRLVEIDVREIHTWNAQIGDLDRPDRLVFDVDPGDGVAASVVVEAAFEMRDRLDRLGLRSFVKTTGGRGFHVVVPVVQPSWTEGLAFALRLVSEMAADAPQRYTTDMSKSVRAGRIYLDYLRNARGATSIAGFSTRASMHGRVSVPITWDELTPAGAAQLTIEDVLARLLSRAGDPWAGYWTADQVLPRPGVASRGLPRSRTPKTRGPRRGR